MTTVTKTRRVVLANPRGFCAGVVRAIDIVERALRQFGTPIYVRHEIVHNQFVVNDLRNKGAIFINELTDAPTGAVVIFSAHGVSQAVRLQAAALGQRVFDATCPLVTKVHVEVVKMCERGYEVVMIGHRGHPEVQGTMGQVSGGLYLVETIDDIATLKVQDPTRLAYVTQTTLSVDDTSRIISALRARFPQIVGPKKDDICYATQNRQDAVSALAAECDVVLVVGAQNSSNSNRLRELANQLGVNAYLINDANEIDTAWLDGKHSIGVTAGASAPDILVDGVLVRLQQLGITRVDQLTGAEENIMFQVPKELTGIAQTM